MVGSIVLWKALINTKAKLLTLLQEKSEEECHSIMMVSEISFMAVMIDWLPTGGNYNR